MRACLCETDTLARLGGDEFVVVLEDLPDPENAASVAQKLIDRLDAPFVLSGEQEVYIGASLGISIFPRRCRRRGSAHSVRGCCALPGKGSGQRHLPLLYRVADHIRQRAARPRNPAAPRWSRMNSSCIISLWWR